MIPKRLTRRPALIGLLMVTWALLVSPDLSAQTPPQPTPTPIPKPSPSAVLAQDGMTVEVYFNGLTQGGVGLLHAFGDGLAGGKVRFINALTDFFPVDGDGYYGLVAAGMEQTPRSYDLSVFAWFDDGRRTTINTQVEVTSGAFIRQDFAIPPDRAYLIDPQIERSEFARLETIVQPYTEEKLWDDGGFILPINSELTSPFGAYRMLNGTVQTRHTGWDLRATVGTPVMAMGAGKVVFAGLLDIRGYQILIDHGYGLYSGYSHLSQVHVTRGQSVARGQIIGLSGNTGRSNGPHLHWEINLNGQWVDSVQFMNLWLPK